MELKKKTMKYKKVKRWSGKGIITTRPIQSKRVEQLNKQHRNTALKFVINLLKTKKK